MNGREKVQGKDAVVLRMVLIFLPVGGYTTESVTHGQCDARPTVRLPSHAAIERHCPMAGTNLYCLVNKGTLCVNNLARQEPATSRLQVRHPNHYVNHPTQTSIGILEIV